VVAALLFLLVMGPIERVGEETGRPASFNNQEKEDGIKAM
jgi:ACS family glucarate transporter-like MFS transporter